MNKNNIFPLLALGACSYTPSDYEVDGKDLSGLITLTGVCQTLAFVPFPV